MSKLADFQVGDLVTHSLRGNGVVTEASGRDVVVTCEDYPDSPGRYDDAWFRDHPDMLTRRNHIRLSPQLIEAAPDLLAALKTMVESEVEYMTRNNLGDPFKLDRIKASLAAIAKAGGAPVIPDAIAAARVAGGRESQ